MTQLVGAVVFIHDALALLTNFDTWKMSTCRVSVQLAAAAAANVSVVGARQHAGNAACDKR